MTVTRIITLAAAAVLGFAATAASADESADNSGNRFYAGASYFGWNAESTDGPRITASGIRLLGGYQLNDYVGFELHLASGGTDKLEDGTEVELSNLVGAFGRINLPLCRWANVFGLVGLARGEIDVKSEGDSETVTKTSGAVGAGIEVAILPDLLYLSADHVEYINDTGQGGLSKTEIGANNVGLRLAFDF